MNPPPVVPDSKRILVVNDDPDIREALIELLASEGYDVRGAKDGAEGIASLESGDLTWSCWIS
jgi:CheY-like chemotaxis protein